MRFMTRRCKKLLNACWVHTVCWVVLIFRARSGATVSFEEVTEVKCRHQACQWGERWVPPNECCDGLSHCKSQNTQWIVMLAPPLAWGNIHGCSSAQRHPKVPVSNTICSKHLSTWLTLFVCRNQSITLWAGAQISLKSARSIMYALVSSILQC